MRKDPSVESLRFDPPLCTFQILTKGARGQTYGIGAPRHLTCSEAHFLARRRREKNWLFSTIFKGKIAILQGKNPIFFRACGGLKSHFYTVNGATGENFSKSPYKIVIFPSKILFFRACGEPTNGQNTRIASNWRVITKSPEILKISGLLTKGRGSNPKGGGQT